jgi:restriction endonuclease
MYSENREEKVRVLIETLRLGMRRNRVEPWEIASTAKSTESFARSVLGNVLELNDAPWILLNSKVRIQLALSIARAGRLRDAAQALTWQEFERFAEECLEEAGFRTERNVRVTGDGRAWQIDVVGVRDELSLVIDCKHWNTPGYMSRFRLAASHQRNASKHLLRATREKMGQSSKEQQALPVILTLSEPPAQFAQGVALVSVEKLPSFLGGVSPYDENLPLITSPRVVVENPMSQPS